MMRFDATPRLLLLVCVCLIFPPACGMASAQAPKTTIDFTKVPLAAQPSDHFDPDAATEAYLAMIPAADRARSDAYFEGGYWLQLWDFLFACAVSLALLEFGLSARMRTLAERLVRWRRLQIVLYWVQYLVLTTVVGFPLEYYEGFVREHRYGLATQNFAGWLHDELTASAVELVLGALAVMGLFAIVRCARRTWWMWGAAASVVFTTVVVALAPVYIQPLFNTIKPLHDPRITDPILAMARANGIPAKDVYQIDASRQSARVSANVSGFGATTRITLNDNLLKRGSPEEIQSVMGHEMGHYVMHHVAMQVVQLSILLVLSFALAFWAINRALRWRGARWGVRDVADPAILPLAVFIFMVLGFVLAPLTNTMVRTQEEEADIFGLNAARQPDGEVQADLQLSEYRKMRPGPIEEFLFFDHPSGYRRIHMAMVWKAENLNKPAAPTPTSAAH